MPTYKAATLSTISRCWLLHSSYYFNIKCVVVVTWYLQIHHHDNNNKRRDFQPSWIVFPFKKKFNVIMCVERNDSEWRVRVVIVLEVGLYPLVYGATLKFGSLQSNFFLNGGWWMIWWEVGSLSAFSSTCWYVETQYNSSSGVYIYICSIELFGGRWEVRGERWADEED